MNYDDPQAIWTNITPCAAHHHFDEDCEWCDAEMDARSKVLDRMSQQATDIIGSIQRSGGPAPTAMLDLQARIETLVDSVVTDPKARMKFEGEVGRRMILAIKAMQVQMKPPTLHIPGKGTHPANGNVRPLRP